MMHCTLIKYFGIHCTLIKHFGMHYTLIFWSCGYLIYIFQKKCMEIIYYMKNLMQYVKEKCLPKVHKIFILE